MLGLGSFVYRERPVNLKLLFRAPMSKTRKNQTEFSLVNSENKKEWIL